MTGVDPFSPEPPFLYECVSCHQRVFAATQPGVCSACSGVMQSLTRHRET